MFNTLLSETHPSLSTSRTLSGDLVIRVNAQILRGAVQHSRRVRAIMWVIVCWSAVAHTEHSAHLDHSVCHDMLLREIAKYKNARPFFFLFIQNFRRMARSRLPLS